MNKVYLNKLVGVSAKCLYYRRMHGARILSVKEKAKEITIGWKIQNPGHLFNSRGYIAADKTQDIYFCKENIHRK